MAWHSCRCVRVSHPARLLALAAILGCRASAHDVAFSQSSAFVEAYDYVEVSAAVVAPNVANPFTDASLTGWFENSDGSRHWKVEGFSDSGDGTVYRIRFMPPAPGDYRFSVSYGEKGLQRDFAGHFHAADGHRRGILRVDPKHPWHFIWEGTGEHYFFNGTTAYFLMDWRD